MRNFRVVKWGGGVTRLQAKFVSFQPGHVVFDDGSVFEPHIKAMANSDVVEIVEYDDDHRVQYSMKSRTARCWFCGEPIVTGSSGEWIHENDLPRCGGAEDTEEPEK